MRNIKHPTEDELETSENWPKDLMTAFQIFASNFANMII